MPRFFLKQSTVVVVAVIGALATISFSAMGEPSKEGGNIEGTIDDPLLDTLAAVVYIKEAPAQANAPAAKGSMSQKKITFNPHILPVVVGSTVECPNDDTVTHNIFSPTKSAKPFNFGLYPPGSKKELVLNKTGVVPFLCNIHSEMGAFIVVCPNAYFAKTDKGGTFKLENVPAGDYQVTFWHEKIRPKTIEVKVVAGSTAEAKFTGLEKGKFSIDLVK